MAALVFVTWGCSILFVRSFLYTYHSFILISKLLCLQSERDTWEQYSYCGRSDAAVTRWVGNAWRIGLCWKLLSKHLPHNVVLGSYQRLNAGHSWLTRILLHWYQCIFDTLYSNMHSCSNHCGLAVSPRACNWVVSGFGLGLQTEFLFIADLSGARGGAVVEALRYKPEGRGVDCRWCYWNFLLT
jgi:hypothetical protein